MADKQQGDQGSGGLGGIGDKLSSAASKGSTSGNIQSYISKGVYTNCVLPGNRWLTVVRTGIETVQQSVYGQGNQSARAESGTGGDQSHHATVDQAHHEKISEFLRDKHTSSTKKEPNDARFG